MKNLFSKSAFTMLALSTALFFSSCKDECKDVTCNNGGVCVEGACDCATGYEGSDCSTETRAKFVGTYSVTGTVTCPVTGNGTITTTSLVVSTSSSAANKIVISVLGVNLTGTVSGSSITLDQSTQNNFTYTGSGSISGTNLTLTINEQDPSVPETCVYTVSGPKQ